MCLSITSFSQNTVFLAKYMEFYAYDYNEDDYLPMEEYEVGLWVDIRLEAWDDYLITETEPYGGGSPEIRKFWWEFDEEESDEDFYTFYTEDDEYKIVFDLNEEEIMMFSTFNEKENRYEELILISKIEIEE